MKKTINQHFCASLLITLLALGLILSGCSLFKNGVKSPKIKLEEVQVDKLALSQAHLRVVLNIQNPNDIDFDVKNLTYTLKVNSKEITSAKFKEKVLVAANKTTSVSLPITVKYTDIMTSALKLLNKEGLPYGIEGSLEVGPFTIPFDKAGTLKEL